MNTKKFSRGMVSKLQRTLLAMLVVIVLFGSLPVGKAHAQAIVIINSKIMCGIQQFRYVLYASSPSYSHYARFRLHTFIWDSKQGWLGPSTSPWKTVPITPGAGNLLMDTTFRPITSQTTISVYTEVEFSYGNTWVKGGQGYGTHIEPSGLQNQYAWCTVW
jgi:hypothetical protein